MLSAIQQFLSKILGIILSILPDSPFLPIIDAIEKSDFIGYINWFVPVGTLLGIGAAWLAAIGIFYTYQIVLRWAKAVAD